MAILIALVYDDVAPAEAAAAAAKGMVEAGYLRVLESSLVTKNEDGKVEHSGERHTVRTGAVTGAVLGGITGLLFAVPVVGIAAGVAAGAYFGKEAKSGAGEDFERFRDQVSGDLQPGGAALLLLGETEARERVVHDLGQYGGTLRSTDLSDQQVAAFQAEIDRISTP